ncbi:MAG: transcriptional regulator of arginine metabolism [Chloroflexota bacterium]|jgi:transcriptional regulator of arginine metabolism|nr:transcriptional regulator of arginine metabolism [Chloroflexota bacterium]
MRGRPNAVQLAGAATNGAALASGRRPRVADAVVAGSGPSKRDRQLAIRDLVEREPIGSQQDLVDRLTARGFAVTQATVSRDVAELGLLKAPRLGGHAYVLPESLAGSGSSATTATRPTDERLRRILADIPVTVGRSGLILLVTGSPGTASIIAQAIDESSLSEQEGTLAGDNTLLVLFADEVRLAAWRARFDDIRTSAIADSPEAR